MWRKSSNIKIILYIRKVSVKQLDAYYVQFTLINAARENGRTQNWKYVLGHKILVWFLGNYSNFNNS